jgi:signal transduction histidine kinase
VPEVVLRLHDFRHIRPLAEAPYTAGVPHPRIEAGSHRLRLAGIATSLISALPVWVEIVQRPELVGMPRIIAWNALLLLFLAGFIAFGNTAADGWPQPLRRTLLAVQCLAALGMAWLGLSTVDAVFLVIVAAQLRGVMSLRPALAWVALQTVAYGVCLALPGRDLAQVVTITGAFGGFQLFALYTFHIAEGERQAREELARTHESLLATRQLLAESSRAAERLRIARELHDALGHHLTALTLNLEAALHAPEEDGRRHVETAQRLARDLLGEVRQVVGALRHEETEGTLAGRLATALNALGAGVEEPLVHLTVQPDARAGDPEVEHALVRCAQEIFTNAVRHAGARNLWLEVARDGAGLALHARDDGRGATRVEPGNGLRGMRERVEERGGRLHLSATPDGGFAVTAWLPAGGGAADGGAA